MKRALVLVASVSAATQAGAQTLGGTDVPNPVVMVVVLAALGLAPFVLMMLTSFLKISVVLSILRNAIGTQQVPPSTVITGLAFILSMFIMAPVGRQMYQAAGSIPNTREVFSEASVKTLESSSSLENASDFTPAAWSTFRQS